MCQISIIIPAFNERRRLGPTLNLVATFLAQTERSFEILVIDDGSSDGTGDLAREFQSRGVEVLGFAANRGKGAAVRAGVLASRGAMVLICDADLSTPIEELATLQPVLQRAPVVLGSRSITGSRIDTPQPLYRRVMGTVFRHIVHAAGVGGIRDTQCGFKLLDGEVGRRLFGLMITDGFGFDVEMVWLAQRLGYGVEEVGIRWADNVDSRVRPMIDPLLMIGQLMRFRWHHRRLRG